jgi:hypothetical protein
MPRFACAFIIPQPRLVGSLYLDSPFLTMSQLTAQAGLGISPRHVLWGYYYQPSVRDGSDGVAETITVKGYEYNPVLNEA